MFKLLLTASIIYIIYRFFIQSNSLPSADKADNLEESAGDKEEFIDYEEVD